MTWGNDYLSLSIYSSYFNNKPLKNFNGTLKMHQKLYIRNDRCFGNNFQKVVADKWHYFVRFIFIVFCSSVTFYFIFGSVEIFLKNEDSSKVIYRKFDDNDATESVYPMISVCIVTFQNKSLIDPEKSAMNKSEIRNYQMAMMGELKYLYQSMHFM